MIIAILLRFYHLQSSKHIERHNAFQRLNIKHLLALLGKVETNIQSYHACKITSWSRKHDSFGIGQDRVQISVLVSPYHLKRYI